MLLRYSYALLGALLGLVAGYALTLFIMGALAGFFWILIFGDNTWPSWVGAVMATIAFVSFFGTFGLCTVFGFQHGSKLEKMPDQTKLHQKARRHLVIGFVILVFAAGLVFIRMMSLRNESLKINRDDRIYTDTFEGLKSINDIQINQIDKGVEIVADVDGPTNDRYDLTLQIGAKGYAQEIVFQQTQSVELKYPQQSFHFEVPFDELASRYRKVLESYVLSFDENFGIDELFEVRLILQLKETSQLNAQKVEQLQFPPHKLSVLLRLTFHCDSTGCVIEQKDQEQGSVETESSASSASSLNN